MIEKRLSQLIASTGILVTLAISPGPNFDPVNPIKGLALSTLGFSALGMCIINRNFRERIPRYVLVIGCLFISWMFIVLEFSGAPINQQIWGMFGRNTGIMTYISLTVVLVAATSLRSPGSVSRVINGLVGVGCFEVIYGLVQASGNDPIKWSAQDTYGTLGNINFQSAFVAISATVIASRMLATGSTIYEKWFYSVALILHSAMIYVNGSFQGQAILGFSLVVVVLVALYKSKLRFKTAVALGSSLISVVISVFTAAGVFNIGPFARVFFQETLLFREDYWHAGIKMTLANPVFGVGIDSYGDWYRFFRGSISTLRTGPDRTSNSAHNIFLDISSGGGLPLLLLFSVLVVVGLYRCFINIRELSRGNKQSVEIFAVSLGFFAFIIQSLISINQIGVGIWGWILLGVLLGFSGSNLNDHQITGGVSDGTRTPLNRGETKGRPKKAKTNKKSNELIPASLLVKTLLFGLLGFAISILPVRADAIFKAAISAPSIERFDRLLREPATSSWHFINIVDSLARSGQSQKAAEVALLMTHRFPRDFGGWKMVAVLPSIPSDNRGFALAKLRELDPFNPNLKG